jgi:DNA repair photolyase
MGTNTDPYQPIEGRFRITRAVLELCRETNHPVSITTKSVRVLDDLDRIASLAADRLAMVMVSITTLDPALARAMEPRAAAPRRRLIAVKALAAAGVPVAVSVSPLIPGLNDHALEAVLEAAADAGAVSAVTLPIRLPYEVAPLFAEWLSVHFPDRAMKVLNGIRATRDGKLNDAGYGSRHRGGGAWGTLVRQRLTRARRRLGLDQRRWDLRTDLFVRPTADARQGVLGL